jgi:Alpha/beta hydrolase domain
VLEGGRPLRIRTVVSTLAVLTVASLAAVGAGAAPAPDAFTIEGPVHGGKGVPQLAATNFDLASVGYEQAEYFISGTATSYTSATPLTNDGKWTITPAATAPYKTRLVVYRPTDAEQFNGTVLVEWNNVSGGLDAGPIWLAAHDELIREGYAWVGVTAQRVGVEGGGRALVANLDLKHADPERYGSLVHPGDSFSYDMYTQAGQAVRGQAATVLGGLQPERVIGAGESQSAFRLTTYIDAVEPRTRGVYDGYLVYSRGDGGAALSQDPQPVVPTPAPTRIRADLDVPVMTFSTETDLAILGYGPARQPDTSRFRGWEVAGTSHADTYTLGVAGKDTGTPASDVELFQTMLAPFSALYGGIITCDSPINAGSMTYTLRASIHALHAWIADGTAPPRSPRLQMTGDAAAPFVLDANGNAKGGIRTPQVDTPVATLSGLGQSGSNFCGIFGTTAPFATTKLSSLYPSHAAFVKAWNTATDRAVKAGFLLPADAKHIKAAAARSTIGS